MLQQSFLFTFIVTVVASAILSLVLLLPLLWPALEFTIFRTSQVIDYWLFDSRCWWTSWNPLPMALYIWRTFYRQGRTGQQKWRSCRHCIQGRKFPSTRVSSIKVQKRNQYHFVGCGPHLRSRWQRGLQRTWRNNVNGGRYFELRVWWNGAHRILKTVGVSSWK